MESFTGHPDLMGLLAAGGRLNEEAGFMTAACVEAGGSLEAAGSGG